MIQATDMLMKLGKKKFIETVTNCRDNQPRQLDLEKRRRWGRVKDRKCEHGVWVIENYVQYLPPTTPWEKFLVKLGVLKDKSCHKCLGMIKVTKSKDFQAHFNLGLGGWVDSKCDMKRAAKALGAHHIGSDRL